MKVAGCASYVCSALPDSHHRTVDWDVNKCRGGAGEQAATRLANGTMKPNRDARPVLNAVT